MIEEIKYKKYTIHVSYEQDAENPFNCCDYMPPTMVWIHRTYHARFYYYADGDEIVNKAFTALRWTHCDTEEKREKIAEILGYNYDALLRESRDYEGDCIEVRFREAVCDLQFADKPDDWSSAEEYLNNLCSLLDIVGMVYCLYRSNGYSQGDSLMSLAVADENWLKTTECKVDDCVSALEYDLKEYSSWVWGDVYQFEVFDADGESVYACGGYYGDDGKASMIYNARMAIDYYVMLDEKEEIERASWEARDSVTIK